MTIPKMCQGDMEENRKKEIQKDKERTAVALSASETVSRYGSANAEYIKGYRGIDNETGTVFAKGLKGIADGKLHPDYVEQNLKQQAGYSAEVAATSRDNAEAIIRRSGVRTSRSDDRPEYGKNHNVVDRVKILDGNILDGSQSQMKFVGDRNQLFEDITKPGGKFARYRPVKLELPSEQYEGAIEHCKQQAATLRERANKAAQAGKLEVAERLEEHAKNYDQLSGQVVDSGLTTEQAIFYRKHPKIATALDITRTSHRAGVEGAKYGAIIGASISLLTNAFGVAQEKKQLDEAALGVALDTGKAAAVGYSTAFAGSALKSGLQQSSNSTLRSIAGTTAPALAVNICISLSSSVKRFVTGEISEAELLSEVGEKGAGMLSSGMMAALGQLAIPIPFVGAAVGGMIGYTLSSFFYQSALDAARDLELSEQKLKRIQAIEAESRARIAEEQSAFDRFISREFPQLQKETKQFLSVVHNCSENVDELALAVNKYAALLGKNLEFESLDEFDNFMNTDLPLVL